MVILLALLAYAGIMLVRPSVPGSKDINPEEEHARLKVAYQSVLAKATAIRTMGDGIQKPEVRATVRRIADQSDQILTAMREDQQFVAAPLFSEQLLPPTEDLLESSIRLSRRGIKSADELLVRNETQDLPMIEQAAQTFYERMHCDSIVDLAALVVTLARNSDSDGGNSPQAIAVNGYLGGD